MTIEYAYGAATPEVEVVSAEVQTYRTTATDFTVSSDSDMLRGGDILKSIKSYIKRVGEIRTRLVKPLNDHVKMINGQFKPLEEAAEDARRVIEGKLATYNRAQEARRQLEAQEKRERELAELEAAKAHCDTVGAVEQAAKVEAELEEKIFSPVTAQRTFNGTQAKTTFVKRWVFEVTDPTVVPREYCDPNESKIRAAVKLGSRDIPGVRIYEETQVQSR